MEDNNENLKSRRSKKKFKSLGSSEDDGTGVQGVAKNDEMNCEEEIDHQNAEEGVINVENLCLNLIAEDDVDVDVTYAETLEYNNKSEKLKQISNSLSNSQAGLSGPTNFETELKKIIEAFPIWNFDQHDSANCEGDFVYLPDDYNPVPDISNIKETLTEESQLLINEIKKVLCSDTTGHPPKESLEYFKAAERYAFYGKKFHEFPEDYSTLYDSKNFYIIIPESPILGDGLYPTPVMPSTVIPNSFGVQLFNPQNAYSTSKFGGTTYYHPLNLQQNLRQGMLASAPPSLLHRNNNLGYVPPPATSQHLVFNKLATNAATNFISNSLANAALTASPALLYSNPLLASKTQQYLSNFIKQSPFAGNSIVSPPGSVDFYERLAYAQALQKQILQYQARATATAVLQQKQQQQQFYHHYNRQQRNQQHRVNTTPNSAPTIFNNLSNPSLCNTSASNVSNSLSNHSNINANLNLSNANSSGSNPNIICNNVLNGNGSIDLVHSESNVNYNDTENVNNRNFLNANVSTSGYAPPQQQQQPQMPPINLMHSPRFQQHHQQFPPLPPPQSHQQLHQQQELHQQQQQHLHQQQLFKQLQLHQQPPPQQAQHQLQQQLPLQLQHPHPHQHQHQNQEQQHLQQHLHQIQHLHLYQHQQQQMATSAQESSNDCITTPPIGSGPPNILSINAWKVKTTPSSQSIGTCKVNPHPTGCDYIRSTEALNPANIDNIMDMSERNMVPGILQKPS